MKPREKLLACGAEKLSDGELLAILLRTGIKGKSVLEFSEQLLKEFGGFSGLLDADIERLMETKGLSKAKVTQLKAILEILKRYFKEKINPATFQLLSPEDVYNYLIASVKWEDREKFTVIFLNNSSGIVEDETLFMGNLNSIPVFVSEILKKALRKGANGIIVAHNHVSGNLSPSSQDLDFTERLKKACDIVEITLLDHIIYSPSGFFSFKAENLI